MSGMNLAGPVVPSRDIVEFLKVDLQPSADRVLAYRNVLSAEERGRADRFVTDVLTRRFVVCRAVLRQVLAQRLNLSAEEIQFSAGPQGKPELDSSHGSTLKFNVSHTGDLAVIAVTDERVLGVDVEAISTRVNRDELASRFFSAQECERYFSLAEPERLTAFFRIWTCKEAYLKATGEGLSFPLGQFSVSVVPHEPPGLLDVAGRPEEVRRWSFIAPDVGRDHAAALAVEGHGWTLVTRTWDHCARAGIS